MTPITGEKAHQIIQNIKVVCHPTYFPHPLTSAYSPISRRASPSSTHQLFALSGSYYCCQACTLCLEQIDLRAPPMRAIVVLLGVFSPLDSSCINTCIKSAMVCRRGDDSGCKTGTISRRLAMSKRVAESLHAASEELQSQVLAFQGCIKSVRLAVDVSGAHL